MVKDTSETDQYDRLLRYIISDGVFVNNDLVQKGYAESFTYPPDVACSKIFNQAEKIARRADLGIWKP
jgi:micrococcal nuclease